MATGGKKSFCKFGLVCVMYMYYLTFCTMEAARSRVSPYGNMENEYMGRRSWKDRAQRRVRSEKPNIVVIMADDQDEMLGSMETMTKTMKLLQSEGARFRNSFVSTPMCCPSRSSFLTGMYPHNHHIYTNNDNCSGIMWQQTHEPRSFAKYLSDAGYRTGYFGKYLNEYNGTYTPPGWREWLGLVRNSRFYNYSVNHNGVKKKFGDNYFADYFTDLIANKSVIFFNESKKIFPSKPVLMMLSVPAPHGPEDAAPQYQHLFENNTLHRTPSWNYMNNSDKQWLLRQMKPLEPIGVRFTDVLQQKRLQTLQSVDDMVEKVHDKLRELDELDNTYIIYTSDHGYHLGQYGIVKGKALPYDFDTRVPTLIRGPGIPRGKMISNIMANVDIAPTILEMAGVDIPEHMDGRSLLKVLKAAKHHQNSDAQDFITTKKPWRDTILIERGKVTGKQVKHLIKDNEKKFLDNLDEKERQKLLAIATPKLRKMLIECSNPENHPPCKHRQKWVCVDDGLKKKLVKCRNYNKTIEGNSHGGEYSEPYLRSKRQACDCSSRNVKMNTDDFLNTHRAEVRRQKSFIRTHVKPGPQSRSLRQRRSVEGKIRRRSADIVDMNKQIIAKQLQLNTQRCRFLPNDTLLCDHEITKSRRQWKDHKLKLDEMIAETRERLFNLKKLRKHMKKKRPDEESIENSINLSGIRVNADENCNCEGTDFQDYGDDSTEDDFFDPTEPSTWRGGKKKGRKKMRGRLCNSEDMKCTTHDNDHWKTPPYWTGRRKPPVSCKVKDMECSEMENDHWKTPPVWRDGPFCFCTNSNNNTYWCLRTVNQTHNFLYCEFISSFINFYDFNKDPYQLHNMIHSLNYGLIQQLHEELIKLRACQGTRSCGIRSGQADNSLGRVRRRRKIRDQRHRRTQNRRPWETDNIQQ